MLRRRTTFKITAIINIFKLYICCCILVNVQGSRDNLELWGQYTTAFSIDCQSLFSSTDANQGETGVSPQRRGQQLSPGANQHVRLTLMHFRCVPNYCNLYLMTWYFVSMHLNLASLPLRWCPERCPHVGF